MQIARELRRTLPILGEHGRDCAEGTLLVQEQHEKLIADELLELGQREPVATLVAEASKQCKPPLVNITFGQPEIEKGTDSGLAWATLADTCLELCDLTSNSGHVLCVDAGMPPRARIVGLKSDHGLQYR